MRYSRMRWRGNNELFAFANDSPCSALASLIFSRYSRKILAPPKLVACRRENSVLILLTGVVDFTLKVLLSLAGFFSSNTILPKNRSPFYVFKRVLLSKFRININIHTCICACIFVKGYVFRDLLRLLRLLRFAPAEAETALRLY